MGTCQTSGLGEPGGALRPAPLLLTRGHQGPERLCGCSRSHSLSVLGASSADPQPWALTRPPNNTVLARDTRVTVRTWQGVRVGRAGVHRAWPGAGAGAGGAAPSPPPHRAPETWAPPLPTALPWTITSPGRRLPESGETLLGCGQPPRAGPRHIQLQPWAPGGLVGSWKLPRPVPHPRSPPPGPGAQPAGLRQAPRPTCSRACPAPPKPRGLSALSPRGLGWGCGLKEPPPTHTALGGRCCDPAGVSCAPPRLHAGHGQEPRPARPCPVPVPVPTAPLRRPPQSAVSLGPKDLSAPREQERRDVGGITKVPGFCGRFRAQGLASLSEPEASQKVLEGSLLPEWGSACSAQAAGAGGGVGGSHHLSRLPGPTEVPALPPHLPHC